MEIRRGVIAIVEKDGKILMGKKKHKPGHFLSDAWHFPGGKSEEGESAEETLHREMKEELGVEIQIIKKICEYEAMYQDKKIIGTVFHCKTNDEPIAGDDLVEIGYFDYEGILKTHDKATFDRLPNEVKEFIEQFFNISVEIINGTDVSQPDLDQINKYRHMRLDRNSIWDHKINTGFEERTFFLIRKNNELVSFGTLRPIKIYIDGKEFEILGMQAVISIIQGKGYGKILTRTMIDYATKLDKTIIGFCERKNTEFYLKSGLYVWEDGNSKFFSVKDDGSEYAQEGDAIYFEGKDKFLSEAINNNKIIKHPIPHW